MYHADLFRLGRTRHAKHYLSQMRAFQALYTRGGDESLHAILSISAIWPQILEAYGWAASHWQNDVEARKLCVAFTNAGAEFLTMLEPLPSQIGWLETAFNAALQSRDYPAAANTLIRLGTAYEVHESHEQAISAYERALAISRVVYHAKSEAEAMIGMGRIRGMAPLTADLGRRQLRAGLSLFREIRDQEGIGRSLQGLSMLEQTAGNLDDAQAYADEAAAISRQSSHPRMLASSLIRLGALAVRREDYQRGKAAVQEALLLARQLGDHQLVCQSISRLGLIEYWLGDTSTSKVCFEEMLSLAQRHGMKDSEGLALFNLAWMAQMEGHLDEAESYYHHVVDLAKLTGFHLRTAFALEELGFLYIKMGRLDEARTHLNEGVTRLQSLQAGPFEFLYVLTGFAWLMLKEGKSQEAAEIMGAVTYHPDYPLTEQEQALRDQHVMAELADSLNPDVLQAALEQGKTRSIESLLAAIPEIDSTSILISDRHETALKD